MIRSARSESQLESFAIVICFAEVVSVRSHDGDDAQLTGRALRVLPSCAHRHMVFHREGHISPPICSQM